MLSRAMHEERTFEAPEVLDLGDDILLPAGSYAGWDEWIEMPTRLGESRTINRRSMIALCADDIRRFGGDVSAHTELLTFDVTKLVEHGWMRQRASPALCPLAET